MARVTIPLQTLVRDAGTISAGTAIDTSLGHTIAAKGRGLKLFVYVKNTATIAGTVTINAGDNPPALRQSLGNLAVAIAASADSIITIETARFAQSDGSIEVDAAGVAGTIYAYMMP